MNLTTKQLRNIIKEELDGALAEEEEESKWAVRGAPASRADAAAELASTDEEYDEDDYAGEDNEIAYVIDDINDALYMLGEEEDTSGTLFYVINRLEEAKAKLEELGEEEGIREGYADAPGAKSGTRSHPKSYEGPPEIADIDIAWRRYGSGFFEQGQKDFLEGMRITSYDEIPEEYRDKHNFYLDGYFDAKNK